MKTTLPKDGSKWTGTTGHDRFHVLHTIEIDGNTWVHYIKENAKKKRTQRIQLLRRKFFGKV